MHEKIFKTIAKNKGNIIKISIALSVSLLLAFILEYFINGGKFSAEEKKVIQVNKENIETDGFLYSEDGSLISQQANSLIVLNVGEEYIRNLEISLGNGLDYHISVEYNKTDGEKRFLEKKLQSSMEKGGYDFLKLLVFNIDDYPQKITVHFENSGVEVVGLVIDNNKYFNPFRFIFGFAVFLLAFTLFLIRRSIGKSPEKAFLAVALICGSVISFSETRSYVSWDEFIHYKNADKISLKNFIKKDVDDVYGAANSVPHSYSIKEQRLINNYFDENKKTEGAKKKKNKFEMSEMYNRVGYIPSASALLFGRLFNIPAHFIFILGRLANLLAYSLIVFFAIRKLKTGKMLMAVIALLPTALFLAANYSYDPWVTAFSMLGLAYLFSELQQPEKKMRAKEIAIMIGAFVIGLAPKAIYFPLMFLIFLLPKSKFATDKQYRKFLLINSLAILIVLGSFMLPFIIKGPGDGDGRGGDGVNATEQVKFVLSHPVEYIKISTNFIKGYINPLNSAGFVTSFAYLGEIPGFLFTWIILVVVMFTDKNKFDCETAKWKVRLAVAVVSLIVVELIVAALYVSFNVVGTWNIQGVQPRYLLPLIFPLLYIFGSSRVKNPLNKNIYNIIIFAAMSLVLFRGIWIVLVSIHY